MDARHVRLVPIPEVRRVTRWTSSAVASSEGGTERPRALAVLRLIASWYFVGACAGRLAGFSPLKMYRIEALLQDNYDDRRIDGYHSSS